MSKTKYNVVSLSGGKDSTAMLLRLLEEHRPIDRILFCDTGLEFPKMYEHLTKLERYIGRPITRLKAEHSFEYSKRKADLDTRLNKMYDKIEEAEKALVSAREKRKTIEDEKMTGDSIYSILICFDRLYAVMSDRERRKVVESLISEIHIYEERQPNGRWIQSIKFKFPLISEDLNLGLEEQNRVESVVLLSR